MDHGEAWAAFVERFDSGRYVEGVLALEEIWFAERDDFHKGLIRICVALNQLRLGLLTSPRFLLTSARALLAPFAPSHRGVDLAALLTFIEQCLALIPADAETGSGMRVDPETLPQFRFGGG
ncbi:MAG TPA: hypothetical protein VGE07_03020 [Herpetosiphonaceae bacterium]